MRHVRETFQIMSASSPISSFLVETLGRDHSPSSRFSSSECHGFWHNAALVVPSLLFVLYLAFHAKKNAKKLSRGRSMIAYFALLFFSSIFNLVWCLLQAWQCTTETEVAWNLLSLLTAFGMLCLEISLVVFLLKENYASMLETLARTLILSSLIVGVDVFLKAIFIFGFRVPLFVDGDETAHRAKWVFWVTEKLLLSVAYGFILFAHASKWRDKLPPRPAFYNYIIVMFVFSVVASFACGFAASGTGLGHWLYNLTVVCYHSTYLPFLYVTFLASFFQEEDWLLDNAYYSEMKDAGFFDADWD